MSLPQTILNGIKSIFVPDMEEMKMEFSNLINQISPSVVPESGALFPEIEGGEPDDFYINLKIGEMDFGKIKIVDYSFLKQGVEYFRPVIQGFIYFLMGFYFYNQYLTFIGQAHHMASAHNNFEEYKNEKEK